MGFQPGTERYFDEEGNGPSAETSPNFDKTTQRFDEEDDHSPLNIVYPTKRGENVFGVTSNLQ